MVYEPSNLDWKASKQAIKLLSKITKNSPYKHNLVKNMKEAIKEKDYQKYRQNMDELQIYYARLTGKTIDDVKKLIKQGYENFKRKFKKKGVKNVKN